jgi:hypothetical protein
VSALALQNALMLAKIVRYEFPHDWPDVVNILIRHLKNAVNEANGQAYVANVLNLTLQVIKELASARIQRTKRSLQYVFQIPMACLPLKAVWAPCVQLPHLLRFRRC